MDQPKKTFMINEVLLFNGYLSGKSLLNKTRFTIPGKVPAIDTPPIGEKREKLNLTTLTVDNLKVSDIQITRLQEL